MKDAIRSRPDLIVRSATEEDVDAVEGMVAEFAKGHPAEKHPRSSDTLRRAYFGSAPLAHLVVASRNERLVGMGQWTLIYDMFWGMFGAHVEWLFVELRARGLGISAAIVAEICKQVREAGGEFLHGGADSPEIAGLYERVAIGSPSRTCYLSGQAFREVSMLAGLPPRTIIRGLPSADLN